MFLIVKKNRYGCKILPEVVTHKLFKFLLNIHCLIIVPLFQFYIALVFEENFYKMIFEGCYVK